MIIDRINCLAYFSNTLGNIAEEEMEIEETERINRGYIYYLFFINIFLFAIFFIFFFFNFYINRRNY
jgi:hypothetical protein